MGDGELRDGCHEVIRHQRFRRYAVCVLQASPVAPLVSAGSVSRSGDAVATGDAVSPVLRPARYVLRSGADGGSRLRRLSAKPTWARIFEIVFATRTWSSTVRGRIKDSSAAW